MDRIGAVKQRLPLQYALDDAAIARRSNVDPIATRHAAALAAGDAVDPGAIGRFGDEAAAVRSDDSAAAGAGERWREGGRRGQG